MACRLRCPLTCQRSLDLIHHNILMYRDKECVQGDEDHWRSSKWFPQLVDKHKDVYEMQLYTDTLWWTLVDVHQLGKSIKVHLYWAMKNCADPPSRLKELILNIPNHYKVVLYFNNNCYMHNNYCTFTVGRPLQLSLHLVHHCTPLVRSCSQTKS